MKVLNINYNTSLEQLENLIRQNKDCRFIHYKHEFDLKKNENLITEARKNKNSHSLLFTLAHNGFYLYMTKEGNISSFVQHKELPILWKKISSGEAFYNEDGIVYSFDEEKKNPSNLLVIFSSINAPIYKTSLDRVFTKNFKSIGKHISDDTLIMRIADLGGITGSFYLNTKFLPENELNIQKLIKDIKMDKGVEKVVLLGASKGATAALYHGILGNYDFVAVDPIVTDDYYFTKYKDLHFMQNIANISKQESFERLLLKKEWSLDKSNKILITSRNSPQYSYLSKIIFDGYEREFSVYINTDPEIKDHPDVSPRSLMATTSLINKCLARIPIEKKVNYFTDEQYEKKQKYNFILENPSLAPESKKNNFLDDNKKEIKSITKYFKDLDENKFNPSDKYYLTEAQNFLTIKNYKDFRSTIVNGLKKYPESNLLLEAIGEFYFERNNYALSFFYFKKILNKEDLGLKEKYFAQLLLCSLIMSDYNQALIICQEFLKMHLQSNDVFIYYFFNDYIKRREINKIFFENEKFFKFFDKNGVSHSSILFLKEKIILENKNDTLSNLSIGPETKWRDFLALQKKSNSIFFKKIFGLIAYNVYSQQLPFYRNRLEIREFKFLFKSYYKSSYEFIKSIEKSTLDEKKIFVYILYRLGDFSLAHMVRKLVRECISKDLIYKDSYFDNLANYEKKLNCKGNFNLIENESKGSQGDWVKNITPCFFKRSEIENFSWGNGIDFQEYISGKNIALVAPVNTGSLNGAEIDGYDVVVRFNYRGSEKLGDASIFGKKTNIGYYAFSDIPADFDAQLFKAMDELDFVIVPDLAITRFSWLQKLGRKLRSRYNSYPYLVNPLLFGNANAVQRALIDLIRFSYKEIKVFNANLYYDDSICPEYGRPKTNRKSTFCYHEPISNYNYTRALMINGWIKVDKGLGDVLDLGEERYINSIQRSYGLDIFS